MNKFSVCIIAKNEENVIERCLNSIKDLNVEIILVDTGSTDSTISIVQNYNVQLHHFEWINDFSAARNFAASKASNDWILALDCDEWIESIDLDDINDTIARYPAHVGLIKKVNLRFTNSTECAYISTPPRLYNRTVYHYEGSIHEQIVPISNESINGIEVKLCLHHTGYISECVDKIAKSNRNISLLKQSLSQNENQPAQWYHLGYEYYEQSDYASAISCFEKVISGQLNPQIEYCRLCVQTYYECLIESEEFEKALSIFEHENDFGNCPDYYYQAGRVLLGYGDPLNALSQFIKATSLNNPHSLGTNTYLSWYYIGYINELFNNIDSALLFYEKCGNFQPALDAINLLKKEY